MRIKLRVLTGRNEGREVAIKGGEFVIGRSKECNLRAKSDSISRRHCLFVLDGELCTVQDLGSKNGTYVNDQRLDEGAVQPVADGDQIRVGKMEFEVLIKTDESSKSSVVPAKPSGDLDSDISDWLEEGNVAERAQSGDGDTRLFRLDETAQIERPASGDSAEQPAEAEGKGASDSSTGDSSTGDSSTGDSKAGDKSKKPGRLPRNTFPTTANSKDAAATALRRYFNRP